MNLEALKALAEAVEAGRDDSEKWRPAFGNGAYRAMRSFHGSLDAALALRDAVLPGWRVKQLHQFEAGHWIAGIYHPQGEDWPKWTMYPCFEAVNANPARALLLAIIRALIAQAEKGEG